MTKIIIRTTPTITYRFNVVSVSDIASTILTVKERGVGVIENLNELGQGLMLLSKYDKAQINAHQYTPMRIETERFGSGGQLICCPH